MTDQQTDEAESALDKLSMIARHWPPLSPDIPQLTQKEAVALLDQITKLQEAQRWRSMDSAPKEGNFLVYMPQELSKVQAARRNVNGVFIIGNVFAFDITAPAAWMQQPELPK